MITYLADGGVDWALVGKNTGNMALEFSTVKGRLDRLDDGQMFLLLSNNRTNYQGDHYTILDISMIKPVKLIPLMIGGGGRKRTLRTAAMQMDGTAGHALRYRRTCR